MIIRLIDAAGLVVGHLTLPASFKIANLDSLKAVGAARVEVAR